MPLPKWGLTLDATTGSEFEPPPLAQHPVRNLRNPAVGVVQNKTGGKPGRPGNLLAHANEDATRCPSLLRPQRKNDNVTRAAGDVAQQHIDAVGPVDECHRT